MKKITKLVTLLLSSFLLAGCSKGFADPVGTPGTAVYPAHVLFYAHPGDSKTFKTEDVTPGKPVSDPGTPESSTELFIGWSLKEKAVEESDYWNFADSIPLHTESKQIKFFGQWEIPVSYINVSFYKTLDDFKSFNSFYSVNLEEGAAIPSDQMPPTPENQGKAFLGWYYASDSTQTIVDLKSYKADSMNCEFVAKWQGDVPPTPTGDYKVTFYFEGDIWKQYTGLGTGAKVPTEGLIEPVLSGKKFAGWSTVEGSESNIVDLSSQYVDKSDLNYYAIFKTSNYKIYFEAKDDSWNMDGAVTRFYLWKSSPFVEKTPWPGDAMYLEEDSHWNGMFMVKTYSIEIDASVGYDTFLVARWDPANTSFSGDPWNKIGDTPISSANANQTFWVADDCVTFGGWF